MDINRALSFVISLHAIIPIIGWILTLLANVYLGFVTGHLLGQIGAKAGSAPKEKSLDPVGLV